MDAAMTVEQAFSLRGLEMRLQNASREELICAVLHAQAQLYDQARFFQSTMAGMGIPVRVSSGIDLGMPETSEDMMKVFGREPSDEELSEYAARRMEEYQRFSGMDIDISAIAREGEEDGGW
jgi:hypothetical protein